MTNSIILTMGCAPLDDEALSDGAYRLLCKLRSLAGHARVLQTFTSSLAALMRRGTNTIRCHLGELENYGYIYASTDKRTGVTTIRIRESVEPPSRQARLAEQRKIDEAPTPLPFQKPRPQVIKPDKEPWWRKPWEINWRKRREARAQGIRTWNLLDISIGACAAWA
jgi:DNA-binding transcriptional MocR family regulator